MNRFINYWCTGLVTVCCISLNVKADEAIALDMAVDQACKQIADDISGQTLPNIKNVAIMPLWGEDKDQYVLETLKSRLTKTSLSVMVRTDEEWNRLLGEIEWNTLREDIMNPQTVQKFGKIEGCDAILYGTVRQRSVNQWTFRAIVRMTVNLADVETGKIAWSSAPITSSVWLEWPEIYQISKHHPIVLGVLGLLALLIIWRLFKKLFIAATRPR